MLEEADGGLLNEAIHHIAQHSADSKKALSGMADVAQAHVIEKDLLDNKSGNLWWGAGRKRKKERRWRGKDGDSGKIMQSLRHNNDHSS